MYELLSKLYYKDKKNYMNEFEKRFNSYGTVKLPFHIKPYKSNEEFQCFYVNHEALDFLHDQIVKQSKLIQTMSDHLPGIAIKQYIRAKLIDELLSTNEIEGVHSTKKEMEITIEIVIRKEASKNKNVRHLSLMKSYFSLLSDRKKTIESIEDIRNIYNHLVQDEISKENELDGELFRKQPVDVVTSTNKVIHRGVYPEESIKTKLFQLIHYLNEHPSPMLYRIAISHYYFGYIHPFYDGNGRTARYISSMYMMNELDPLTALTLSYSTNKLKQMYYEAFLEANNPHNKGELTFFCETFFHIIEKAQNDILADLSEKKTKMDTLATFIKELNIEDEIANDLLLILGQNDIFGIEGKGLTKKELTSITEKSEYIIGKALEHLMQAGYIEFLKRKPIEVALSKKLMDRLK
jgi:Fic family protein